MSHRFPLLAALGFASALVPRFAGARPTDQGTRSTSGEVPFARPAPFDRWCVATTCAARGHAAPPLVTAPPVLGSSRTAGLAQQAVERAIARSLDDALHETAAEWNHRPLRDIASAVLAAIAEDETALGRIGGLGASAVRVGVVAYLAETLPPDAGCIGPRRLDAIYEGLASSVALAPLGFPESLGTVAPLCVATAARAESTIDTLALRTPISEVTLGRLEETSASFDALQSCVSAPEMRDALASHLPADRSVRAMVGALDELRGAAVAAGEATALPACLQRLEELRAIDPAPLDTLIANGLADVEVAVLVSAMRARLVPCTDPTDCGVHDVALGAIEELIARRGRVTVESLGALVRAALRGAFSLPKDAVITTALESLAAGVVPAGVASAVVGPGEPTRKESLAAATIDPRAVVAKPEPPSTPVGGRLLGARPSSAMSPTICFIAISSLSNLASDFARCWGLADADSFDEGRVAR
jgi:hypothetical protein